jgi:hypothetical protein
MAKRDLHDWWWSFEPKLMGALIAISLGSGMWLAYVMATGPYD